jgi:hypothetical protein
MITPLGNSELGSQDAPKFNLKFLSGEISGSILSLHEGEDKVFFNDVPVIQAEMLYRKKFVLYDNPNFFSITDDEEIALGSFTRLDGDSVVMILDKKDLLLSVEEENSGKKFLENFDLEVFIQETGEESYKQLFFRKDSDSGLVKDNILLDPQEVVDQEEDLIYSFGTDFQEENNPEYVQYYLDLTVDNDIDRRVLCRQIKENIVKDIFTDIQIDCTDFFERVYQPDVYRPEDYEDPCDD